MNSFSWNRIGAGLLGAALLALGAVARADTITVDLGTDCTQPTLDETSCLGLNGGSGIAVNAASNTVEILFTLNGLPDAHVVTNDNALWDLSMGFAALGTGGPFSTTTTIALSDMDGLIPGQSTTASIELPFFGPGGTLEITGANRFAVPGLTFVHDLHFDLPGATTLGSVNLRDLIIQTDKNFGDFGPLEHFYGIWDIPEPATLLLLAAGLAGLGLRRRQGARAAAA